MYIENSRGPRTDPCATSDHLAVYTAELIAIATALHGVEQVKLNKVIREREKPLRLLCAPPFWTGEEIPQQDQCTQSSGS